MSNIDVKSKVPIVIRQTVFWADFLDVISDELNRFYTDMSRKKYDYNLEELTKEELLSLARGLKYDIDLSIDTSEQYIKNQLYAMIYKINNKGNYNYYDFMFRSINHTGYVFLFYRVSDKYIKGLNIDQIKNNLGNNDFIEPFIGIVPEYNWTELKKSDITLDQTVPFILDDSLVVTLDQSTTQVPTNHIAVEYFIDELITKDGIEYCITSEYIRRLENDALFGNKITTQAHIGVSLSCVMDESGAYDAFRINSGEDWSVDGIKLLCAVTSSYSSIADDDVNFVTMVFGNGTTYRTASAFDAAISGLTDLVNPLYKNTINQVHEIKSINEYKIISTYAEGNLVNDELLGIGDGSDNTFPYTTDHLNITPKSVKISYTQNLVDYEAIDDGDGHIYGEWATGGIAYDTGVITLNTYRNYSIYNEIVSSTITGTGPYYLSHTVDNAHLVAGDFEIRYYYNGVPMVGIDQGDGTITGTGISSGTINYTSGEIVIEFGVLLNSLEITVAYNTYYESTPDNLTNILIDYSLDEDMSITEAGILNDSGDLVAYATFPPIELIKKQQHAYINFIIQK